MTNQRRPAADAPSWRFIAVATVGAYISINALLALVLPFTHGWPIYAVTAVVVPPMTIAMIYVVIPLARRA